MRMSTGSQLVSATPSPWWLAVLVVRQWLSVARQDAECDELSQPHLAPAPPPPLPGQGAGPAQGPGGSDQGLLLRPRSVKLSRKVVRLSFTGYDHQYGSRPRRVIIRRKVVRAPSHRTNTVVIPAERPLAVVPSQSLHPVAGYEGRPSHFSPL